MYEMNEFSEKDVLLDQVLAEYPQAALPPGFVGRVMAQIETAPVSLPVRFQLQFVDLAVPTFVSLLLVGIILLAAQTDWLLLLTMPETAVSPAQPAFQFTPTLTAVTIAIIGELALVAVLCWRLWGDPADQ